MAYSELVCQSHFSFLTGASSPEELVTTASFLGYHSIAITDECSVAGVVRAYTEIRRHRLPINLIVGSRLAFSDSLDIVLLCPTKAAYSELCRIITNARRRAEKGSYQLAEWDIKSIKHCFIVWLPSLDEKHNDHWADWLIKHHNQRTWIGAQRRLDGLDTQRYAEYDRLHQRYTLPIAACGQVLMHHSGRLMQQHVLHAIRVRQPVSTIGQSLLSNAEQSLRPIAKLTSLFPAHWLKTTIDISQRCTFSMEELKYQYPAELIPEGKSATGYLRECVETGIKKRFPNGVSQRVRAIIEKELTLIAEQAYEYFFLTIHDVVQFAKREGILYQGRGSAANSVVCYCLEITAVDPEQIDVLFERFISKERNEPPDIDVDFEHERREEVIQYIYQKYGRERTALAATVISFRFKSAFREVGKALGYDESQLDFFIKHVNRRDRAQPWQAQLADAGLGKEANHTATFIRLVEDIVGTPRHLSQHVGGFVISEGPLYNLVPVENASMTDRTVIQWDKDDLESLGLLKVDVLALGMLTAIRKAFHLVKQHFNYDLSIARITAMPDDPQVFNMLCRADTVGVFQIESRAQMSMLPRLKPKCYYDLVVQIAIVRPGPIQGDMVHPYLRRRHAKEAIVYPSKEVQSVLQRTMGVPIFQEQVIQLAMVAAGFSGGEADQLRRAMASWKKTGELNKFRDKLVMGMEERGYETHFAIQLFEQIKGFGEYGFPESHSASFAVLAYVSAWLKYYFPAQFYAALLNSLPMGFYSASQLIQDAQRHGIKVLPPCVNASDYDYTLEGSQQIKALRVGLRQIKGINRACIDALIRHRPHDGYTHLTQLLAIHIKQDSLQALTSANALAKVSGDNRFDTRWQLMDTHQRLPLFEESPQAQHIEYTPTEAESLLEDYASMSLSIDKHPIALLQKRGYFQNVKLAKDLKKTRANSVVSIVGCVTGRQAPGTASGVTFVTLEDHTGNINVVVWQATSRHQKTPFLNAKVLQVDGIIERSEEGVVHVIAGKLTDHTELLGQLTLNARNFH